ncbi:MAG: TIGR04255 family protein [Leptospirillum sp.]
MSVKMSNAPVYYALAQAQFSPVATMNKYVSDVQDRLRREGYTLFEPLQMMHLQFAHSDQKMISPNIVPAISWLITKGDRTSGFILNDFSVTYHTTHYETNEQFIPELLRGLKTVHEVVQLDHVSRLGLRYLDAVLPQPGESVDQYLAEGLCGIRFCAIRKYALYESVFETECGPLLQKGTLMARVHQMTAPLGYPPGIVPHGLLPKARFDIKEVCSHAVIDMDHYAEGQISLDFDKIGKQIVSLHKVIKNAFEATTTDHSKAIWS